MLRVNNELIIAIRQRGIHEHSIHLFYRTNDEQGYYTK